MLLDINPIWITLGPIALINVVLFISYLSYQLWFGKRKKREFEGTKNVGSKFLSTNTREWWFWTTNPIVKIFVKLHIGPNLITAIGFLIAVSAGYLFACGWFGYAGWAMIFGATFDMFDGRVARLTGKESRSGAFFDSVMDRFGEGACLLGLAYYFRDSWMLAIVIAALIGSTLVSYTRARGEGFGVVASVGSMQRPERVVYLGVASVFDPVMGTLLTRWWELPPPLLVIIALIFVAIMTNVTAIHRMIYVMNALDTEDRREKESIPQLITKLSTQEGREEFWERARYGYDRSKAAFSRVVLFHVGAMDNAIFRKLLANGDLPNISRHLVERGGISDMVTAFPSTSGPASAPFVTGCFPGTCDIPGVRWFDRTVPATRVLTVNRFRDYIGWGAYAMDYDLSKSVRTIFEYSKQAANIFGMLNRGCGFVRDPAFFRMHSRFQRARRDADLHHAEEAAFYWFQSAVRRETDFVFYSFPPLSFISSSGGDAESMLDSYRKLDSYIGKAVEFLKEKGMHEGTAMMLASDCSVGRLEKEFDLNSFLGERYKIYSPGGRIKEWQNAEAISLTSGTSMSHIYVRHKEGWQNRSFFEDVERKGLIGSLLENECIDILAGRSVEGGIVVQSRRGRAHILEDADGRITYIMRGGDPFGYRGMPQALDAEAELATTFEGSYPDGIMQILQLFRSKRTGDIVISTGEGISITDSCTEDTNIYTHGSLSRGHVMVPLLSSIDMGERYLRTADVFATALEILGIESAHSLDGAVPKKWIVKQEEAVSARCTQRTK